MRALTRAGLKSPAAIAVGVAVTMLFGVFALYSLPIQLFPDIDRPQIGIETDWRAETPREVESQLVQPEEDVLQGIPGLQEMDGFANSGGGYIQLTFALGNRHEEHTGRRDRQAQPPAAASRRRAEALRPARQHPERQFAAALRLHAEDAGQHARRERLYPVAQGHRHPAPRSGAGRGLGPDQLERRHRRDRHRLRSDARRPARRADSPRWRSRSAAPKTSPAARSTWAGANTASSSAADTRCRRSEISSWNGATASPCIWATSPTSMSAAARRPASPIRTATRRWACRCSAPTAQTCWPRSTR